MSACQAMMTTLQIWAKPEAEVCLRHREPQVTRDNNSCPLPSDGIDGGFPPHYPGSGTLIPVPDDAEPAVAVIPDGG